MWGHGEHARKLVTPARAGLHVYDIAHHSEEAKTALVLLETVETFWGKCGICWPSYYAPCYVAAMSYCQSST